MFLVCATAVLGGGLTAISAWSALGLASLLVAPLGGSLLALGAALVVARHAQTDLLIKRNWISDLQAETQAVAANDVPEVLQGERRYA